MADPLIRPGISADREYVRVAQRDDPPGKEHSVYLVLSEEERAKGFVRPLRSGYVHLTCGTVTIMALELAETYARDPSFYGRTWCNRCRDHFPVGAEGEFDWAGEPGVKVGT